jgi:hypothetical protein
MILLYISFFPISRQSNDIQHQLCMGSLTFHEHIQNLPTTITTGRKSISYIISTFIIA